MLLVGNYGNGNIGDESILARLLELIGDSCEVFVLSRHPESVKLLHGANAVRTFGLTSIRAFLRTDIFAIGGGGIFGRGMTTLPKLLPSAALAARLLGKKTVYLAIGAYPGTPTPVRQLLQLSALFSDLVSVRDAASFDTINVCLFGRSSSPILVHDPAIDLSPISRDAAGQILRDKGVALTPPPLGLSIKATPSPELNKRTVSVLAAATSCSLRSPATSTMASMKGGAIWHWRNNSWGRSRSPSAFG
jgi:polysaccharide pyruvyl transferase WcaK-like protein